MKTLILSILALAVLAAGTGKRNYEWPHATQWYGYFTQDSSGGVTQAVSKTVAESTLTGDGFALKRNIGDTLTANVRGWQTASGHVDSARAAYKADTAKTAAFAYAATYGDTSRAAKVADSAKKIPVTGTAGTYRSVTTDAYGRVISGTTPTTLGPGYGISFSDTVLANHYLRKDTAQTMGGKITLAASTASTATMQIPAGSAVPTSLSTGDIWADTWAASIYNMGIAVRRSASDNIGSGPIFIVADAASPTKGWAWQLGASNDLAFWNYASSAWTRRIQFLTNGSIKSSGLSLGSYETLTAAGAVSLSVDNSFVSSSSAITVTLANGGTAGQRKTISNFSPTATIIVSYSGGTNSTTLTLTPYTSATWVSNGTYWAKQ